jgi:hypothetical protein
MIWRISMKYLVITLMFSSLLYGMQAGPAMAGSGHSHGPQVPISQEEVVDQATSTLAMLVDKKKIDASWEGKAVAGVEQKTFRQDPEWVVKFKNEEIKDTSKKTLYLFFSIGGEPLGANYSGD